LIAITRLSHSTDARKFLGQIKSGRRLSFNILVFIEAQSELKEKGVQLTICIVTNGLYVMEAWNQT
jgi:hypothetical protein